MFGIDVHPEYQKGIDFTRVLDEGYKAIFIKVSEGTSFVPDGLDAFAARAIKARHTSKVRRFINKVMALLGKAPAVIGFYHFLDNTSGDRQAANFCRVVNRLGGPKGRVLIVDFESYGAKSPSNKVLKDFVAAVKKRFPDKKVLLYSGYGFWTGGDSSGDASQYGVDGLWDARYADLNKHASPKQYWRDIRGWYLSQAMWGGSPPPKRMAAQYTSQGLVANKYVDVNKFFVRKSKLERFAA